MQPLDKRMVPQRWGVTEMVQSSGFVKCVRRRLESKPSAILKHSRAGGVTRLLVCSTAGRPGWRTEYSSQNQPLWPELGLKWRALGGLGHSLNRKPFPQLVSGRAVGVGAAHVSLLCSTCLLSDVNGSTLSGWFLAQGLFNQMSFNKEISNECFDFFFLFLWCLRRWFALDFKQEERKVEIRNRESK